MHTDTHRPTAAPSHAELEAEVARLRDALEEIWGLVRFTGGAFSLQDAGELKLAVREIVFDAVKVR